MTRCGARRRCCLASTLGCRGWGASAGQPSGTWAPTKQLPPGSDKGGGCRCILYTVSKREKKRLSRPRTPKTGVYKDECGGCAYNNRR